MILQTVAPDYRKRFFDALHRDLENNFSIYAKEDYFEDSVKSDTTIDYLKDARNCYFFNRRLLFQYGMWNAALSTDVLVIELNPGIISNWILLFFRIILAIETILWGYGWFREGKKTYCIEVIQKVFIDLVK